MRCALALTTMVGLLLMHVSAADARKWKPTKLDEARDYLQIQHNLDGGFRMVVWIAPSYFDDIPETRRSRETASKFVMILLVDADVSPMGQWSTPAHSDVAIEIDNNHFRQPIEGNDVPPAVASIAAFLATTMSQGMGEVGKGTKIYVFDGQGISECGQGIFWIHYDGERYDYETPIPSCE